MGKIDARFFGRALLDWYRPERRPMPWKAIGDPYHIWLSEIILQQTRVAQGLPYYERFVARYPRVEDLAAADDEAVMKLWEGLGYYSRARNLLKAARLITHTYNGQFPTTYAELQKLPGVGPYTAAAIASFAFDAPIAVLDGNVFRILARFTGDDTPIDASTARKHFQAIADTFLGQAPAARFNQAIMDFGALVCTPKNAQCPQCPLQEHCVAYATDRVYTLPRKRKKLVRRRRYFHFLVLETPAGARIAEQRSGKDIWRGLYQFPLLETASAAADISTLAALTDWPAWLPHQQIEHLHSSQPYQQQLTHQTIVAVFHRLRWHNPGKLPAGTLAYSNKKFEQLTFPKVIKTYLADRQSSLSL